MSPALKHHQHLKPYLDKPAAHYVDAAPTLKVGARAYRGVLGHYYRLIIPPNARVLEIGCGDGSLLRELPNRDVTGFDVPRMQLAAVVKQELHTVLSDRLQIGAACNESDVVTGERQFDTEVAADGTSSDDGDAQTHKGV